MHLHRVEQNFQLGSFTFSVKFHYFLYTIFFRLIYFYPLPSKNFSYKNCFLVNKHLLSVLFSSLTLLNSCIEGLFHSLLLKNKRIKHNSLIMVITVSILILELFSEVWWLLYMVSSSELLPRQPIIIGLICSLI